VRRDGWVRRSHVHLRLWGVSTGEVVPGELIPWPGIAVGQAQGSGKSEVCGQKRDIQVLVGLRGRPWVLVMGELHRLKLARRIQSVEWDQGTCVAESGGLW